MPIDLLSNNLRRVEFSDLKIAVSSAAAPQKLYDELSFSWPDTKTLYPPSEVAVTDYGYHRYLSSSPCNLAWWAFWNRNLSDEAVAALLTYWSKDIRDQYPHVCLTDATLKGSFSWRPALGDVDPLIPPHVDNSSILITILWYFPVPGDRSSGGGLNFYRFRGEPNYNLEHEAVGPIDVIYEVPYLPNHLVMFLNNPIAVHGGVPRSEVKLSRRHVSINLKIKGPRLFTVPGRFN